MHESPIQQVSDTAFMAAAYRAMEASRPDALFHDPLAAKLAGEQGRKIVASFAQEAQLHSWAVAIRTLVIDNFLQTAIAEGVDTILSLGAGLDTRPYRLDLPSALRWVEVDYPHLIELKENALAGEVTGCRLERTGLDLTDVNERRALLDRVTAQSGNILVLTEAVTPYLSEDAVAALGADLRARESIRYWIADYFSPASYRYRRKSRMSQAMQSVQFQFEPDDYFGFFARIGWSAREIRYFVIEGERLQRPIPLARKQQILMRILGVFAGAQQREQMKRHIGFVLFEPAKIGSD